MTAPQIYAFKTSTRPKTTATILGHIKKHYISALNTLTAVSSFKVIIFCNSKTAVTSIHNHLKRCNWSSTCYTGDDCQQERNWSLFQFKSGNAPILITTVGDAAVEGSCTGQLAIVFAELPTSLAKYKEKCAIGRAQTVAVYCLGNEVEDVLWKELAGIRTASKGPRVTLLKDLRAQE